jgi:hypothetical protein
MKRPVPTKAESSAPDRANFNVHGGFPAKHSSVSADVLARLLNSQQLTSIDTAADTGTARLAAVVSYLKSRYGWPITSTEVFAGCPDGRRVRVTEYTLPPGTVDHAVAAGAAAWCADVRAARRALRADAKKAYRMAHWANAVFKTRGRLNKNRLSDGAAP